MAVATEPPADL